MRILLAHNSLYFPSNGGGDKSNRLLMQALAGLGHAVRVFARVERFGAEAHASLARELEARGVAFSAEPGVGLRMNLNGVDVHVLTSNPLLRAHFSRHIAEFDPDIILASTDDPGQLLLDLALQSERARVVYLIRALIAAPFGPGSSAPNAAKTAAIRRADGVVAVSESVAGYVRRYADVDCRHFPISLLGPEPAPVLGGFDNDFILLVNPCAGKGISIFLDLAGAFPRVAFAAVPGWGTTATDLENLRKHDNVSILRPADDFDEILRQTRIVLVPSLWAEARSRVILEAMSRGIPVMASNVGGLAEAKLGVDYLLPVNPIVSFRTSVNELMVPAADVPAQDTGPWRAALSRLLTDRVHYEALAAESRAAALAYAESASVMPFAEYLESLLRAPKRTQNIQAGAPALETWSPEKRRLLAARLKQRKNG
jgi:glycosyltransferase involved in cell wall biosynthesis